MFLSARPHLYQDVSENISFEKFRELKKINAMHTLPSLLSGDLDTGTQFLLSENMEHLAKKKFENLKEYMDLYPEYQHIFIGDSGQGDVRAAEMIFDTVDFHSKLERVYIHEVTPLEKVCAHDALSKTRFHPKIFYFKSYVDAALDAYVHRLIGAAGLARVCTDAVRDFEEISEASWADAENKIRAQNRVVGHSTRIRRKVRGFEISSIYMTSGYSLSLKEERMMELHFALRRVDAKFVGESPQQRPLIATIKFSPLYPVGTAVVTPFGIGVLNRFRITDGINEVDLLMNSDEAERVINSGSIEHLNIFKVKLGRACVRNDMIRVIETSSVWVKLSAPFWLGYGAHERGISMLAGTCVLTKYGRGKITRFILNATESINLEPSQARTRGVAGGATVGVNLHMVEVELEWLMAGKVRAKGYFLPSDLTVSGN